MPWPKIEHARTILMRGTSADRQLDVYTRARASGADEEEACRQVVDWLIEETVWPVLITAEETVGPAELVRNRG